MQSHIEQIPSRVKFHTHTQITSDGTMFPIPLALGGGDGDATNDGDNEPDHDGGHGPDGDGNWGD